MDESSQQNDLQETTNFDTRKEMPITLRPEKMWLSCPHCRQRIITDLHVLPGPAAYFFGLVIILLGGVLGCCLIPCCVEECMDVHHTCPHCDGYLGKFRHFCC